MMAHVHPVRFELVEGPFLLSAPRPMKKLSFDKLRTIGSGGRARA
jgi:hypothetical protein